MNCIRLVAGQLVSENEIDQKIGSEFTRRRLGQTSARAPKTAEKIAALLERCRNWELTALEVSELEGKEELAR